MKYWWVNHKQTYKQEISGQYIWSPKKQKNGATSHYYDNMCLVEAGDIIFSYANGKISNIGVIQDNAFSCSKPEELQSFNKENNNHDGWKVPVLWQPLYHVFDPKNYLDDLASLLNEKYAPYSVKYMSGNQAAYLSNISQELSELILKTQPEEWVHQFKTAFLNPNEETDTKLLLEEDIAHIIQQDKTLSDTERKTQILARRGQGLFRNNVKMIETACRVTGITDDRHLIASHIKPWSVCASAAERIDGHNGFLLCPNADHLFNQGYISFSDEGDILISSKIDIKNLNILGCSLSQKVMGKPFSSQQKIYLDYHRKNIFNSK